MSGLTTDGVKVEEKGSGGGVQAGVCRVRGALEVGESTVRVWVFAEEARMQAE